MVVTSFNSSPSGALTSRDDAIDAACLTEEQATLLIPLWSRAIESGRDNPLLHDRQAVSILERLDFDFDQFRTKRVPHAEYCIRARVFDQFVQSFLDAHPAGTVIEIGVGLDTRFERLDNGKAKWIELDLPQAMHVRRQFIPTSDRREMISGSLLESDWLDRVEELGDGPSLFVAEGVLYFFNDDQVRELFGRLADRFPGSGLLFDAQSPLFLKFSNLRHPMRDSKLTFSVGHPERLTEWDQRLSLKQWVGFGDSPYYNGVMHRVSPVKRWCRRVCPPLRKLFKVIHVGW